jgi:DNA repair protein RadC
MSQARAIVNQIQLAHKKTHMTNNIINEVALYYPNPEINEPVFIKNSKDAHNVLRHTFNEHQLSVREEFVVLSLNRSNHVLSGYCGFKGFITRVVVDRRLIFLNVLKALTVKLIERVINDLLVVLCKFCANG